MPQTKQQKKEILEELDKKIEKQKTVIFFDFTGLKVKDFSSLRKSFKTVGDELKVVKKTLMDLAFKKAKLQVEPKKMSGEIALVFGYQDELSPAKMLYQFGKSNKNLKILGGFFEGKFREAEEIIALAQLPSKEELIANLFFTVKSPLFAINNLLQRNLNILKVKG
jgi:large subunit ribosomal protein L10